MSITKAKTTKPINNGSLYVNQPPSYLNYVINSGLNQGYMTPTISPAEFNFRPSGSMSNGTTYQYLVKNSPGQIGGLLTATNAGSGVVYLKFYDKTSVPTPSTDVPLMRFAVPGNTTMTGAGISISPEGIQFNNGISYVVVSGAADSNSVPVSTGQVMVSYGYR